MPIFSRNMQPPAAEAAVPPSAQNSPEKPGEEAEAGKWFNKRPGPLSFGGLAKRPLAHEKLPMTPPPNVNKQLTASHAQDAALAQKVDPSRLSQFSLRLNELVNKAFVAPNTSAAAPAPLSATSPFSGAVIALPRLQSITYGSHRLPDRVKVIEMTRLIVNELQTAAAVDPYLLRAVSRAVLKSISLFVTRIESLLVPAARDPSALVVPSSVRGAQQLPAAMEFNLALMSLEWIVEESLERCLEGLPPLALLSSPNIMVPTSSEGEAAPRMPPYVHEILSPLREQMEASIIHVVQPVLVQVKSSLAGCIAKGNPYPFQPQKAPGAETDLGAVRTPTAAWLKELEERLDTAHRLLFLRVVERCGQDGQAWYISVAIHLIWKGLVAITSRSVFAPASVVEAQFAHTFGRTSGTAPSSAVLNSLLADESSNKRVPTPTQLAHALRSVGKPGAHRLRKAPGEAATGAQTPVEMQESEFDGWKTHFMLPNDDTDCYVVNPLLVAEQLHDLQVFERLMTQFASDLTTPAHFQKTRRSASRQRKASGDSEVCDEGLHPARSHSSDDQNEDEDEDLAHAALKEALAALQSTVVVLRTLLQEPDTLQHLAMRTKHGSEATEHLLTPAAVHAFNVIPELLLVHIAFCRIPPGWTQRDDQRPDAESARAGLLPTPPQLFGYTWAQYEAALTGFAAGEAAASSLARLYAPVLGEVYHMLDERCADHEPHPDEPDASSIHSESSAEGDVPSAMTQSAPALDHLHISDPPKANREAPVVGHMNLEHGEPARSRSLHRNAISNRFWRRSHAGGHGLHLPNALPPRVSRANATSSPYLGRHRRTSPPGHSNSSLPRSRTHTLAHMQRNALNMFDSVLRRVDQTYRSTAP